MDFFLYDLSADISELGHLLGMNFIPGNSSTKHSIAKHIQKIIQWEGQGENNLRDYEYARLQLLLKELKEIQQQRPVLLSRFKRDIRKARKADTFFGTRFEVNIAASLIRKDVVFDKAEAPDFTIHTTTGDVFLECGSGRIRGSNRLTFADKVAAVVGQKAKKPYCRPSTALAVDVTNVAYSRRGKELDVNPDRLRDTARVALSNTKFGSVLLFVYMMNLDRTRYESNYVRMDNVTICPELADTLDHCFPLGDYRSSNYILPEEG